MPEYELTEAKGPAHAPVFTYLVKADGRALGTGSGHSKQQAQLAAAENALKALSGTQDPPQDP